MKCVVTTGSITFVLVTLLLLSQQVSAEQATWNRSLAKAAKTGNLDLARKALTEGADVNARVRYWEDDTWTALLIAVHNGNIPEVGQENRKDIKKEYVNVASLLLERGANVNVKTRYGITPLMYAVGNVEMLKLLLDYDADIHATDNKGMTALGHAARRGRTHTAMLLIQHGADITVKTDSETTILFLAADGGGLPLVRYLLEHGLDVNAKSGRGTALMAAARRGYAGIADVIELLLEYGADPEAKTSWQGETALMEAAE